MNLTRRDLLKRGTFLVAAGLSVPTFIAETAWILEQGMARPANAGDFSPPVAGPGVVFDMSCCILLLVQLAGGNDGLNTLILYADLLYAQARPTLVVPANQVLALDDK